MKNVTISMDEETLREVRIEAAKAGTSVSRYITDVLTRTMHRTASATPRARNAQMEALERVLSGPKWNVMREGRMPTSDERNER